MAFDRIIPGRVVGGAFVEFPTTLLPMGLLIQPMRYGIVRPCPGVHLFLEVLIPSQNKSFRYLIHQLDFIIAASLSVSFLLEPRCHVLSPGGCAQEFADTCGTLMISSWMGIIMDPT